MVDYSIIHLPFYLVCPHCGMEQPHIVFCVECGAVWMGTCGHGGDIVGERHQGIDLGALEKRPGDGNLHVYILEPEDGQPGG